MIKDIDDMIQYFPDYKKMKNLRDLIWMVVSTLNPKATKEIIKEAREKWSSWEIIDLSNLVKITSEMKNAIIKSNMQKSTFLILLFILIIW